MNSSPSVFAPLKRGLAHVANGFLIVAALAATIFLVDRMRHGHGVVGAPPPVYQQNETLPANLPIDIKTGDRALLLVLNTQCRFCTASMPAYKALTENRPVDVSVVVLGREPEDVLHNYIAGYGIRADRVASIPQGYFKSPLTPLVILIDHTRTVIDSWVGEMDSSQEGAVRRAMLRTGTATAYK